MQNNQKYRHGYINTTPGHINVIQGHEKQPKIIIAQ
jgi:hypothetical protein